ncbi:response regulator [Alcanivorax sp. IO_7]|nr:response regulator [Alcanivorax sp. IO_7]
MLVQHQNASSDNRLAWLLQKYTRLPVVAPEDKERIRPGHVYVAPPGYHMLVDADHTIALTIYRPVHFSRPSIDELFFSAGHVYGRQVLGVILTGANEDGSEGLDYIRRRGGPTLAQSPQSSEAPAMPEAAIAKGAVETILDLERIGPYLAESLVGSRNEKQNILVVDDHRENLVAMEALLEEGRNLVMAQSGNEALALALKHDFALVLLDVQMPEMDGFEVAQLMRRNRKTRHIPIIFVTAISKEQRYVFKGYETGAVDYLFKPVDEQILDAKVNVFLELDRQRRKLQQAVVQMKRLKDENERLLHALGEAVVGADAEGG